MSKKTRSRQDRGKAFSFVDRSGRIHGKPGDSGHVRSEPKQKIQIGPRRGGKGARKNEGKGGGGGGHGLIRLKATVDKNRKGFGFLIFEKRDREDVFVPPRQAETLFHGDRVEVTLDGDGDLHGIKVLEHRFRELVGRFSPHPNPRMQAGWVIYERKRAREEVYVPEIPGKVKTNDWVRARLEFHESGPFRVTAKILDVYGTELPPSADVGMIAAEFNLIEEHSAAAESEARSHRLEIPGKDLEGRTDLREVPFITIDGETARDFDDAIFVERNKSGYILWVAIADVSHYVTEASALDQDARSRGTSVYFPERAFHMLPRALSENLCSLRPNEPRLALAARMEIDRVGKITKTDVMEAVIESRRRATYNEIQAEYESNRRGADVSKWEYSSHFELYQTLRKMRSARGSIDFDLPEAELVVKPTGEVVSIRNRTRLDAHRLIEEFMIAANEAVTVWMMNKKWPFVYRVHDEPAEESLKKFQALAATVGVRFSLDGSASPKVISDIVRRFEGNPAQDLLNMSLLRSMKQAVYSSTHGIHYGLASEAYTHFTSPIRRYPDLVVHRLLRRALRVDKQKDPPLKVSARESLEKELSDICEHCSYRERLASDAERESIRLKQVRAMLERLGDEFDAKIIGMAAAGLFVSIADPYCEGLVSGESMTDDFYQFNEERMIFYGKRKKRTFKIGDKLRVRALRADLDRRQIDFGLVDGKPSDTEPRAPSIRPNSS